MSNRKSLFTLAMICVLVGVLSISPVLADDKADVKAAVGGFYDALHAHFAGQFEPMEKVWSHASDITYLGPSGDIQIGWDQVGPTWKALAAMKMGGTIKPEGIHIILGGDIAIVTNREVGKARGEEVDIRVTTTFRKEDGKWLMIGHHADPLAFLQQEAEHGTPEEAQALVGKAIAAFEKRGSAVFDEINSGGFRDGDLYVFVYGTGDQKKVVAYGGAPVDPPVLGRPTDDVKDADGLPIGKMFQEKATPEGAWVDYRWKDPTTGEPAAKSSWVVRSGDYVFGCGVYK